MVHTQYAAPLAVKVGDNTPCFGCALPSSNLRNTSFYTLVGFLQVLLHFQLMVFHSRETLKHFGIVL